MIGYIYKITSPSDKVYIGKSVDIKQRFGFYKRLKCKSQPKLYNSLVKYGYDNHKFEILGKYNSYILSSMEIYFISKYDSYKSGMNCTIGGDGAFMVGDDNISKRPEVREKMRLSKELLYSKTIHPRTGVGHTDKSKEKIRTARYNQKDWCQIPVLDLDSGVYYTSITELSRILNIKYKSFFYQIKYTNRYKNKYLLCI
jgi:group I intron endonuclease